jgi:hypothetical protein
MASFDGLPPGRPGCAPPSPIVGVEVKGTSRTGQLYGLIFQNGPITTHTEVKIAWRITGTGSGKLTTSVTSPSGRLEAELWGPELHGGSNYARPGTEYGTGYIFDEPGCWRLHFVNGDNEADAFLQVA